MFSFLKKNKLYSPLKGKTESLVNVNDKVFSSLMMGDGIAIDPIEETVVAPCDCTVKLVMSGSNHAVGLEMNNGIEILIHVGIDTVNLASEGFEVLVNTGEKVNSGTPLIKFDKKLIESKGYSPMTMMIITDIKNNKIIKKNEGVLVEAGKDVVIELN